MQQSSLKTELKIWNISIPLFQAMMRLGLGVTDEGHTQHITLIKGSVGAENVISWLGHTTEGKHPGSYNLYDELISQKWDTAELYREDCDDVDV